MRRMAPKVLFLLLVFVLVLPISMVLGQDPVTLNVVGVTVPPEELGSTLDLAYQALVTSVQEANPNITVNAIETPPEFETQILVDLAAGTAPDIWRAGHAQLPELIEGGHLLDMRQCSEVVPELTMDRFVPSVLAIHQPEGADGPVYGLPNGFTPMVFYYNTESFERAGVDLPTSDWTVDQFLDAVQRLTLDTSGRNAQDPAFDAANIEQYGFRVRKWAVLENLAWIWLFGGDVFSEDYSTVDGYLNSPETIEAIAFLRDLVLEYHVAPEPNALDMMIQERAFPAVFLDGAVAMYPRGHWELVGLQLQENYSPDKLGVVGYPVGARDATIAFEDGWVINAAVADDPAKLEAACQFVNVATDVEFQRSKVETGLEISANQASADESVSLSAWPDLEAVFVAEMANVMTDPNARLVAMGIIEPRLDLMFENILAGADVTEEVNLAVEEIERELQR